MTSTATDRREAPFWEQGYRDMAVSTMGGPNHDIVEILPALRPGARVLDLGAGEGRNAFFLAVFDSLHASQRDSGWRHLGENGNCYKRQSVYAGYHHDISAAIAARQGDRAQELMHQHLSDVQRYIFDHAFPAGIAKQ